MNDESDSTSDVMFRNYPKIREFFSGRGSDMCVSTRSVNQGFAVIIGNKYWIRTFKDR
jgi:hypothetical protein